MQLASITSTLVGLAAAASALPSSGKVNMVLKLTSLFKALVLKFHRKSHSNNLFCQGPRDFNIVLRNLKRDLTGNGFTHIGSDGVARTFDRSLQVVDAAPLEARTGSARWSRSPGATVLDEVKVALARSDREVVDRSSGHTRGALVARQENCVSEYCPDDAYCQGLSIYGYNCTSCLIVSDGIGNCQEV